MSDQDRDYRFKGGRSYHGFEEEAYYLPNDETEVSRLDVFVGPQSLPNANAIYQIFSMKSGA